MGGVGLLSFRAWRDGGGGQRWGRESRVAEAAGGERGLERLSPRTSHPKEGAAEGPAEAGHRWGASP